MSPREDRQKRKVFVAYSYRLFQKKAFRRVFKDLGREYDVDFLFADEALLTQQILAKVSAFISDSDFSLFEITDWNPNVTLELGMAYATGSDYYILFKPGHAGKHDAPSDIRGIDRLQWRNYDDLQAKLSALLDTRYSRKTDRSLEAHLNRLRGKTITVLGEADGLTMIELAQALGIDTPIAQLVLEPLIADKEVRFSGERKGRRYFLR